jgi:hypothetical protein
VLQGLLARKELGANTEHCLARALSWVAIHEGSEHASFIIQALLVREDGERNARACLRHVLRYLEAHREKVGALYVLRTLLERDELAGMSLLAAPELLSVVEHAAACLREHYLHPGAAVVFAQLLEKRQLPDRQWQRVAEVAAQALFTDRRMSSRSDLMCFLLERPALLGDGRERVTELARTWVSTQSPEGTRAKMILARLGQAHSPGLSNP